MLWMHHAHQAYERTQWFRRRREYRRVVRPGGRSPPNAEPSYFCYHSGFFFLEPNRRLWVFEIPHTHMGGTAKQIAIAAMAIALQLLQIADPLGPLQCNMPLVALAQGA